MALSDERTAEWQEERTLILAYLDIIRREQHRIRERLDLIMVTLNRVELEEKEMATDLTQLKASVERNGEVEASAVTLLQGLASQLADLKTDPVAIQGLADQLRSQADDLAAAVAANTPAA